MRNPPTNPATHDIMAQVMGQIKETFANTPASQWINSPEVTALCEKSRMEANDEN